MDGPLDSWEQWRRGTPGDGYDPSTRSFPDQLSDYGQLRSARYTSGHSTSSLARVKAEDIERSTKIVSVEAASHLAGYEDPIKLILPPVLQEANVVYVKRKFAVGNTATEVPERAPAPVVSVQEETRRVSLRRFGGDIDFNVNACAVPDLFRREMDLKVGAQHAALADRLVAIGYKTLIDEGTDFTSALMRSNHGLDDDVSMRARRFYFEQVFGALSTNPYPIHNLLAAAKRCTAYDISKSLKSVLILPHGVPEMMSYARAENMRYEINGVAGPQGKPVTMKVDSGYKIPATTASVFVHIPPALHLHGSAAPVAGQNSLEEVVQVYHKYDPLTASDQNVAIYTAGTESYDDNGGQLTRKKIPTAFPYYVDITDRSLRHIGDVGVGLLYSFNDTNCTMRTFMGTCSAFVLKESQEDVPKRFYSAFVVPQRQNVTKIVSTEVKTMHAILATPGEETGNLLMQYPRSTVSADASTESGRMQLRVYMGAVLKRPENVLVMRNVAFNGVRQQTMLGAVSDPICGTKHPKFTAELSVDESDQIFKTVRTQPCMFPSAATLRKYTKRDTTFDGITDKMSYERFVSQLIQDDKGNVDIIKELTKIVAGDDASKISDIPTRIATGTPTTNAAGRWSDTIGCAQIDFSRIFADYYPKTFYNALNKYRFGKFSILEKTVPQKDVDLCSSILRSIILHSTEKALDDQRSLDHDLGISESLTELYCTNVAELRDLIIGLHRNGNFTEFAAPFLQSKSTSLASYGSPFATEDDAANFGKTYWDNVQTPNAVMQDTTSEDNEKHALTVNNCMVESSMYWLHMCALEAMPVRIEQVSKTANNVIEKTKTALTDRTTLEAAIESNDTYPTLNCAGGSKEFVDAVDKKPALGNAEYQKWQTGYDLNAHKAHMNQMIRVGLDYTQKCGEVLYLFCLITQERNNAMEREKYRFGSGAQYIYNEEKNMPSLQTESINDYMPTLINGPPPSATVPNLVNMNLSRSNTGQFKSLDDLNGIDRLSGVALQRFDPLSDQRVGL